MIKQVFPAWMAAVLLTGTALAQHEARSIFAAVHLGDLTAIRAMLAEDTMAIHTARHRDGVTPLHYAVNLDRIEIVHLLLKAGLPVNACTDNQTTPLHWAADKQVPDSLRLLLKHGADPAAEAVNGWTALHFAAKHGDVQTAGYLLAAGAPIDAASAPEGTPLHIASRLAHTPLVRLLLEQGASVAIPDAKGQTALELATDDTVRQMLAAAAGEPLPSKPSSAPEHPLGEEDAAPPAPRGVKMPRPLTEPLPRESSVIRAAAAGTAPPMPPRTRLEGGPDVPVHPNDLPPLPPGRPVLEEPEEPEEDATLQTVRLLDGSVYRGEVRRGRFHGYGILDLENGQKYEGEWRRGQKQGIGTYSYPSGDRYSGEWRDDAPHGKGVYHYGNGGRVEGVWRNGILRSGEGIYVATDGSRHRGVWRDNELVETMPAPESGP